MKEKRTVTKEYKWEAAHRLIHGYPDNCRHLHGHSYRCTITMELKEGQGLNEYGFVVDFNEMKRMKKWIDDHFDHACFVSDDDDALLEFIRSQENRDKHFVIQGQTSAENIAQVIFEQADSLLSSNRAHVTEVAVMETCTSEARIVRSA